MPPLYIGAFMRQLRSSLFVAIFFLTVAAFTLSAQITLPRSAEVPPDIKTIFNKPMYNSSTWGLRVLTSDGHVLIDYNSQQNFYIGSVRKVFSVGQLLNAVGPDHTYDTPVYRVGTVDSAGVLHGNLVLVASGDLTMGGRTNPDGTIAISGFDHNEADSLGNAVLTAPDPLAGYAELAKQVAAAGIKKIDGDVIIDDRLFQAFDFRGEFHVAPIFVNDDVVDLTINPGATAGSPASIEWRPQSAALGVDNKLMTGAAASQDSLKLDPEFPKCIGTPNCTASITGSLPLNYQPPLTNKLPLVQTFRIVNPTNYARTVFIEKLQQAGVSVSAPPVKANAIQSLPARNSYAANMEVAKLKGMPYAQDARLILKVSYNIGADTSLVLFGLTQGVDNMKDALAVERQNLVSNYAIPAPQFQFIDGSGGGDTTASNFAVTRMLAALARQQNFQVLLDALPSLGVDGSLGFVTDFEKDAALAGAKAKVHAKTGTYAQGSEAGLMIKGQAFGGYIDAKSGKRLIYQLVVNNVPVTQIADIMQIFQDEGTISAILWRDN
jgi:D-alanyl-D-alanine carboxypeptidase